jgi:hypothetical protein
MKTDILPIKSFKLSQKPEHAHNTVHPKAKVIYLVITCPCTAGDLILAATRNRLHNGRANDGNDFKVMSFNHPYT